MRTASLLLVLLALSPAIAAERQPIGVFGLWGAFVERQPPRCFAIAEPVGGPRAEQWRPFVAISNWPQRRIVAQVHFRLSREKRAGSAILLRIDDRTFQLAGGGANAWGVSASADREIVRAIRTGVSMSIETRSVRGARIRDFYQLRGAATAIDAAAIACADL